MRAKEFRVDGVVVEVWVVARGLCWDESILVGWPALSSAIF